MAMGWVGKHGFQRLGICPEWNAQSGGSYYINGVKQSRSLLHGRLMLMVHVSIVCLLRVLVRQTHIVVGLGISLCPIVPSNNVAISLCVGVGAFSSRFVLAPHKGVIHKGKYNVYE